MPYPDRDHRDGPDRDPSGAEERPYVGGRGPAEDIVAIFITYSAQRGEVPGYRPGGGAVGGERQGEESEEPEPAWLDLISSKGDNVRSFEVRDPEQRDAVEELARDVVDAAADDLIGCDLPKETFLVRFKNGLGRKTFTLRLEAAPAAPIRPPTSLVVHHGGLSGRDADVDDFDRRQRVQQDLDAKLSIQFAAAALDAHSQARDLPRDITESFKVLLAESAKQNLRLSQQLEHAQSQVNQLTERYSEVIQRSNEVDLVKNAHEIKLKEQDRKAAREKHAWDTAKGLLPLVLPFVMARFGATGAAAGISQAFSGGVGGAGGSPFGGSVPFPGGGSPFPGAPGAPGAPGDGQFVDPAQYGGTVTSPPQPPPGFMDGIPGLGGIDMQVAMQIAPVLVQFLTEISDDQVVEIAESEDGVVHLTPVQRRALLVMRKLFGSAAAPAPD